MRGWFYGAATSTGGSGNCRAIHTAAHQHVGAKRQRDFGRRPHHNTNDGEDYSPGVYSDTEHSEYGAVQPPRRKRRRVSAATHAAGGTARQQQTRPESI